MMNIQDVLMDFERRLLAIEKRLKSVEEASGLKTPDNIITNRADNILATLDKPKPVVESTATMIAHPVNSSSLLATVGIIFVILAGIFFIKLSIDSGWLTPTRQVLLAAGIGLTFFLIPQFFPKAEKEYGSLLAGAGTTILHLSWLGAFHLHHLISGEVALVCATVVGVISVLAHFEGGNRQYTIVAIAGTYLSAPLIGLASIDLSILSIFLIIWNIAFSCLAFFNKRRSDIFMASYFAVLTVLLLSSHNLSPTQQQDLLTIQILQFVIFALAMLGFSRHYSQSLTEDESRSLFPLLLIYYFTTHRLLDILEPQIADWFGVMMSAVVMGIYIGARALIAKELKSASVLTSFAALVFVHSFYFQIMDEVYKPAASLLIGVLVVLLMVQNVRYRTTYYMPMIILFSTFVYGAIITIVPNEHIGCVFCYNMIYGVLALIAVMGLSSRSELENYKKNYSSLFLLFAHLEMLIGIYRISKTISGSGSLFVTIFWGLYAIVVMGVSYWRKDRTLGNSALTILVAVSLKAFFYDMVSMGNLLRVGSLLIEGLLLYACGWVFKKMQEWV